jgi:hypothetical protein
MDHLGDLRQPPVPRTQLASWIDGTAEQQHDAGSQPLATGCEQMFRRGLQNRMARADQGAQVCQQHIQVVLDWLKQLSNSCHTTSVMPRY